MTDEQRAAFIMSQSICALAEIESMKVANAERALRGESPAYGEKAFADIPGQYGLGHNDVISYFRGI